MNRRELLKRLAGGLGAGTAMPVVNVLAAPENPKRAIVVLTAKGILPCRRQANLIACWREAVRGTDFEHVKTVVCDDNLTIEIKEIHGRISF